MIVTCESDFCLDGQMSVDRKSAVARVAESGLLKTQGLIGGTWVDAYDGKTIKVCVLITSSMNSSYLAHFAASCIWVCVD